MLKKLRINIVSESAVSVQGHGVHTAYEEMAAALEARSDVDVIRNQFDQRLDVDIVHFHTVGTRTYKKLFQPDVKKVISVHVVPDSFVGSLIFAAAWRPLAVRYLRWFYNHADLLLSVSDQTTRELYDLGVIPRIETLYNSIDTKRYGHASPDALNQVRKELGIKPDDFVVIGAGQVQPRKRLDTFVSVARRLPGVTFVWVGGMPFGKVAADSANMQRLMDTAPSNVIFTGIVPFEAMPAYYQAADAFWLPSEQETFGLVVVEGAASGLPVLLRDIPDYAETFGSDALYGRSDDDFVRQIEALRSDKAVRSQGQQAAARIANRFDSARQTARLVELYRELV